MAHMVSIAQTCRRCGRRASCEVFNSANATQGVFCAPCGKRRLREIERIETAPLQPGYDLERVPGHTGCDD